MRTLTKQQTDEYFNILGPEFKITDDKICDLFARKRKSGIKFYTDDEIVIGPEHSKFVTSNTLTTTGIFLFNKICLEQLEIFGYVNKVVDGDIIKKIDKELSTALMEDDINVHQWGKYIDDVQYLFGGVLGKLINVSLSKNMFSLPPRAKKLLSELHKQYKAELEAGDPMISVMIERKVCDVAYEELKATNDPSIAIFESKCGIDFYNNYKTMFVQKGAVIDNTGKSPTGYKVITSNYDNGITKNDLPKLADSLITTAYSKGQLTADGGYKGKKSNVMYERVKLAKEGSDCGSKEYALVDITEDNYIKYQYRYIVNTKGKIIRLSKDNIKDYIGKTVKMRDPMFCKQKEPEYCNICHGDRKYKIGMRNIGLSFNIMAGNITNIDMKKFHDITIKTYAIDIQKDIMDYIQ